MGDWAPSGRLIPRQPHRIPLTLGFLDDGSDASCPFPFLLRPVILTTGRSNINGRVAARGFRATVNKTPQTGLKSPAMSSLTALEAGAQGQGVGCRVSAGQYLLGDWGWKLPLLSGLPGCGILGPLNL